MRLDGAGEDKAFGGEHDDTLIFIYLEFFTGDDLALHGADAKADAAADGNADTGGTANVLRGSAASFVEDAGGGPECAFVWFLHECVGD